MVNSGENFPIVWDAADICASLKFSNNGNCVIKVEGERFPGRVLDSTKRTLDPSGRAEEKGRKCMAGGRRTCYTSLDSDRVVFMKYPWVSGNRQMVHSLANSNDTDPVNEVPSFSLREFVR